MAKKSSTRPVPSARVDELIYEYSGLSDEERRQFDRKYTAFRNVRRQFGGVFERMRRTRSAEHAPTPGKG